MRETGLGFDRNFMITDETGKFITARRYPQMVLFTPVLLSNGIYLRSPEGSGATILFEDFRPDHLPCEVWGNHFTSLLAPEKSISGCVSSLISRYSCAGSARNPPAE